VIVSLAIAWCLLSVPLGIVLGMCMRQGLSGDVGRAASGGPHVSEPVLAGDEALPREVGVPAQRRPLARPSQLQDV